MAYNEQIDLSSAEVTGILPSSKGGTGSNNTATSGKILIGDGTNFISSTPTYPNASATSRKIIVSDGTNFVASTETWAVPGTSGNVLTSNGTNWTSAAPGVANLTYVTKVLTSAQVKALHATPIQVVPAQGAGTVIVFLEPIQTKLTYGGTNPFTSGGSIGLYYGTTTVASTLLSGSNVTASQSQYLPVVTSIGSPVINTSLENTALNLYNTSATEFAGNAAGNNTVTFAFYYYVINI